MTSSLTVTAFIPPNGRKETVTLRDLESSDVSFFLDNQIILSMESVPSLGYVLYADIGRKINDDPNEDPDEILVFSNGRSAKEIIHDLKEKCESALKCL